MANWIPRVQPNAPAQPLRWIIGIIILLSLTGGVIRACSYQQQQATQQAAALPEAITPETLMRDGYAAFQKAQRQTDTDLVTALAWSYLQQANQQPEPLVWLRTQLNDATYDFRQEQNAKLTYTDADVQRIAVLRLRISALGQLMDAYTQNSTAALDAALDLQSAVQETESFRSLFDAQVIERRYPQ